MHTSTQCLPSEGCHWLYSSSVGGLTAQLWHCGLSLIVTTLALKFKDALNFAVIVLMSSLGVAVGCVGSEEAIQLLFCPFSKIPN